MVEPLGQIDAIEQVRSRPLAFDTTTSFSPRSFNAASAGATSASTCSHRLSWR